MKAVRKRHPESLKKIMAFLFILLVIVVIIITIRFFQAETESVETRNLGSLIAEEEPVENSEHLYATSHKDEQEEDFAESEQKESYATSHKEETEDVQPPLTDEPVKLSDIYAEPGCFPTFKSYYPDAERYLWEIYSDVENGWKEVSVDAVTNEYDELYRKVSVLHLSSENDSHDEIMIRCTVSFAEKESITDIATLHILKKDIESLFIEDFKADSGYISAQSIPVTVKYKDGSQELLQGLSGLYFLEKQESSERTTSISGNSVETITTVITARDYFYLGSEETDMVIRYQVKGKEVDIPVKITGEDMEAPVIEEFNISDFTISNIDIPIAVTVTINAKDNITPYPQLLYAFLPEGKEAEENDWYSTPSFEVDITQNGKWLAYCKDQSGNIASEERNMIVVDNKAPVVSLSLESESWCKENKILVNAKDGLSMEYCYSCMETGETSGWISRNEYEVLQNSTWKVAVRDAAGNVTEQDITVSNIDSQMPVIRNITEKKGEIIINEKKN